MSKTVSLEGLGAAIADELTLYHTNVITAVDREAQLAAKELVSITKATAPRGHRGQFRRNISSKLKHKSNRGSTYVWYVKAPDYRLTHLLVHGHATRSGGRTKSNPFLANALASVLPKFTKNVEEALKNG